MSSATIEIEEDAKLTWTSAPTTDGYYWLRFIGAQEAEIMFVQGQLAWGQGSDSEYSVAGLSASAEWYGPLEMPR